MDIIDNYHITNKDRLEHEIRCINLKDDGFYGIYYKTRSLVYNDFKKNTIYDIIQEYKISFDDAKKIFDEYYISHDEYVYYNSNKDIDY
jgi:hypothetical protein